MSILLDTHMWIWWLTPGSPLTKRERSALDAAALVTLHAISAISLWEAQVLHTKGRLKLPLPFADWLIRASDDRIVGVLPLDRDVVLALDTLPGSFQGDPADRIIVATARAYAAALATRDTAIRKSRLARLWSA